MIAVVQRVARASVTARTGEDAAHEASIGRGWLALVAVERGDGAAEMEWMADKLVHLRIFPDAEGKMNLSLLDIGGEAMVISQFTLAGEMRKLRITGVSVPICHSSVEIPRSVNPCRPKPGRCRP